MYQLLLFLHVMAAIVWVGGMLWVYILGLRLRSMSPAHLAVFFRQVDYLAGRTFAVAGPVLLLVGVPMTLQRWEFSDLWILLGLAGLIFASFSGARRIAPLSQKMMTLTDERGPEDPEVGEQIDRLLSLIRVDLAVLVAVVALMTIKPNLPG